MREVSVGQTSGAAQRRSTLVSARELAIRDPQGHFRGHMTGGAQTFEKTREFRPDFDAQDG